MYHVCLYIIIYIVIFGLTYSIIGCFLKVGWSGKYDFCEGMICLYVYGWYDVFSIRGFQNQSIMYIHKVWPPPSNSRGSQTKPSFPTVTGGHTQYIHISLCM